MNDKPELVYGIFSSLIAINVATVLLLFGLTRQFARLATVDTRWLGIGILTLCYIGAYSIGNSSYGVWVALGAGLFGWLCAIARIPVVPLVLGLVIGDMLEASLRQALSVSGGSLLIFVNRPISAVLLVCCVLALGWPLVSRLLRRNSRKANLIQEKPSP